MKVIVLDYSCPRVAIIKDVPSEVCNDNGRLEDYMYNNAGFKPGNCSWMTVEDWCCNDIDVLKYRVNTEHVGGFNINPEGMGDPQPEPEPEPEPEYWAEPEHEELEEGEELAEGEELDEGEDIVNLVRD